jgi:two-component system chemotaxis response regulator CheB
MIKVLIVEDSILAQMTLVRILKSDPNVEVIGTVTSGTEAIAFMSKRRPDVITMDLHLPGMNGLEATRRIMETTPVPIIIVSSGWDNAQKSEVFNYIEAGAVAAIEKPCAINGVDDNLSRQLLETVRLMSEVKVVRRVRREVKKKRILRGETPNSGIELVAIGASTGGPPVLKTILSALPRTFPVPILIVQHISAGFCQSLADWLNESTELTVKLARSGEKAEPGIVYIAPDDADLCISKNRSLVLAEASHSHCPSVSSLFKSVCTSFGRNAIAILLTGMGKDGAEELKLLRNSGAITIAQDKQSCVVFGMPGEAVKLDGASYILPPDKIAETIESALATRLRQVRRQLEGSDHEQ